MSDKSTYISYGSIDYDISFPEIPSPCPSSEFGWSYKDEILLDPDDRPLELAVNSKSPLTFHLVTGGDRNAELLKNLRTESFTPEQRRRLIEKFNLTAEAESEEVKNSVTSSPSTPRHRTSLSGSSTGGSLSKIAEGNQRSASPLLVTAMAKLNGYSDVKRKVSLKHTFDSPAKSTPTARATRSNTMPGKDRPATMLPSSELSNSNTRKGRVRNVKQRKEASSATRKDSRSASARKIFRSLRKYRSRSASRDRSTSRSASQANSDTEDASMSSKNTELSSDVNLPGILKIFGDAVSPGANYKSVMATSTSNARELVKTALERYGIARQQARCYVLCEVVGRINESDNADGFRGLKIKAKKNKRKSEDISALRANNVGLSGNGFVEDYVRPLSDYEKPLVLQSYWKPLDGHCRRFEIRRRSKVFKRGEKDHATREVNMQARRLVMQKSRSSLHIPTSSNQPQTESEDSDDEKITSFDIRRHASEELNSSQTPPDVVSSATFSSSKENNPLSRNNGAPIPLLERSTTESLLFNEHDTAASGPDALLKSGCSSNEKKSSSSPPSPYLITLQGNEDNLIHSLDNQEVLIGSDATDFKLVAPDILGHHCVIKRRLEILFSESENYEALKRWCVTITPLSPTAEVRINGSKLTSKHTLQHGELLSIGNHHMFMFKDPSSHVNLSNVVTFSLSNSSLKESDNSSIEARGSNNTSPATQVSSPTPPKLLKVIETELSYELKTEDRVLGEIFGSVRDLTNRSNDFPLAPATLLCHCIIHSCLNFDLQHKNDLLLKIASNLQTLVLNATRSISIQEIQSSTDPGQNVHLLLPSLRPVVYWMSNSLEIFEFLQKDLVDIIRQRVDEETEKGQVDPELLANAKAFTVNEEILALLEEVVMYAFQQLVYYLTKTLYSSLPAILECNPFAEENTTSLCVSHITDVYTCAREMTETYDVNARISDQLFAYLFFFTNVSLFNTLMEEDAANKYYKWEMGVRIRGNLEFIESWAAENGYVDQCTTYLEKISSLANLLATPRGQFLKGSWSTFRKNFCSLNPSQLKKVLDGYRIPGGYNKPKAWAPAPEDMNNALDKELILESYDNHPPLMLPISGTKINFRALPVDSSFQALYQRVKAVGVGTTSSHDDVIERARYDTASPINDIMKQANIARQQSSGHITNLMTTSLGDITDINKSLTQNHEREENSSLLDAVTSLSNSTSLSPLPQQSNRVQETDTASPSGGGRIVSSSTCSSSSEPEAYVIKQHKSPHQQRKLSDILVKPSDAINDLVESEERGKACDELLLLPVGETASIASQVSSNRSPVESQAASSGSGNASISSHASAQGMPKEVFIVDIKKGKTGLGVGLVDGAVTSLGVTGVFVRSLIPDGPPTKHAHTKHHDIIRCWLQEGRLQLGDRILAANGVSLINMNYYESMKTLKQAGDKVRLLVGRCGSDVAMKITSSSC